MMMTRIFETHPGTASRRVRPLLLVEDNPMDVDFALQAMSDHNVANPVVVCRDGEEAIEYMAAHTDASDPGLPVLVLLDLRLPKVDGIDVLRSARALPVWRQVPFVVMTTSRENCDVASAYECGVSSYIVKPMGFAAFADVVKSINVYWLLTNVPPFVDLAD